MLRNQIDSALFDKDWKLIEGRNFYEEFVGTDRWLPKIVEALGPDTFASEVDHIQLMRVGRILHPNAKWPTINRQTITPFEAMVSLMKGTRPVDKAPDGRRTRYLTLEEAEGLLESAAHPERVNIHDPDLALLASVAFLLGTGVRTGELFVIDRNHFDWRRHECFIAGEMTGAHKTMASARMVWIPEAARPLLGGMSDKGLAFRKPSGAPYPIRKHGGGQMAKHFNKIRDAAGLGPDVTPYTLRHTWATWYYAVTKDLFGLMDRGGWTKAETAMRYQKPVPSTLADELRAANWDFGKDPGTSYRYSR